MTAKTFSDDKPVIIKTNRGNTLIMTVHYPKENPPDCIESITSALAYCGVFDGIKEDHLKASE